MPSVKYGQSVIYSSCGGGGGGPGEEVWLDLTHQECEEEISVRLVVVVVVPDHLPS